MSDCNLTDYDECRQCHSYEKELDRYKEALKNKSDELHQLRLKVCENAGASMGIAMAITGEEVESLRTQLQSEQNLTFERVVEFLKDDKSGFVIGSNSAATWLVKNREKIIGDKNE